MSLTVTRSPGPCRRLGPVALSAQLRAATRQEHVYAESAFALESRLVDLATYRLLLVTLEGFYLPVEAALARLDGCRRLAQSVDVAAHRRGDLLTADLRRLSPAPNLTPMRTAAPEAASQPDMPVLESPAQALGALYVLAGSALGGRVIARQARAALGDDLPVAFFSSADRLDPQRRWRALQAALDAFGATAGGLRRDQSVQAARQTFRALTERLTARG